MKNALYVGSFDPITKGHINIIERAVRVFDSVIVGIGNNPAKKYTFTEQERLDFISQLKIPNVTPILLPNGGLTADFAYEHDAVLIKGVRASNDFDYERFLSDINLAHNVDVDTVIFPCDPSLVNVSSSATKEICKLYGNTHKFVTLNVKQALEQRLTDQIRITLTGTIGSGKSTIMKKLMEIVPGEPHTTYHNIDLDRIAHDILFESRALPYIQLRSQLKQDFVLPEWSRKALGDKVFYDRNALEYLNQKMRKPMLARIRILLNGLKGVIVFNGALMIENDWLYLSNNNVVILDVDTNEQMERLKARGYDSDKIFKRISSQYDTKRKAETADFQIQRDNYGKKCILNTTVLPVDSVVDHIRAFVSTL